MTDEQRVRLVRQILEQLMRDELDEAEALKAIDRVRDRSRARESAAAGLHLRVARGGGLSSAARSGVTGAGESIVTDEFAMKDEERWNGRPRRSVTIPVVER
jgi:hypothetical protein